MSFELIAVESENSKKRKKDDLEENLRKLPEEVSRKCSQEAQKNEIYKWIKNLGKIENEGSFGGYARGGSEESYQHISKGLCKEYRNIALQFHKLFKIFYYHREEGISVLENRTNVTDNVENYVIHTCKKDKGIDTCENNTFLYKYQSKTWISNAVSNLYLKSVGELVEKSPDDQNVLREVLLQLTFDTTVVLLQFFELYSYEKETMKNLITLLKNIYPEAEEEEMDSAADSGADLAVLNKIKLYLMTRLEQ